MACGVRYAVRQWKLYSGLIAGFSSARNALQFSAAFPDQRLAAFRAGRKQWMLSYRTCRKAPDFSYGDIRHAWFRNRKDFVLH